MTDQPHTPTLDSALDEIATILARFRSSKESIRAELDQLIAQVESAAEQRGAVRHLREVASELNMHHLTEDLSDEALELGVRYINLIQDRADQIANKENE